MAGTVKSIMQVDWYRGWIKIGRAGGKGTLNGLEDPTSMRPTRPTMVSIQGGHRGPGVAVGRSSLDRGIDANRSEITE